MTIKEAKEQKKYNSTECDDLAIKCRKATNDFLAAIRQQSGIDNDTIKKAESIAKWFIHITPIENYLKEIRKKNKADVSKSVEKPIEEDVMVSAKSGDEAINTAIEAGKKQEVNVTVTETKTIKFKDLKHLLR